MTESTSTESAQASKRPEAAVGGVRRAGLVTLPPLVMLFLGLGVVQIFLAGLGVFSLDGEKVGSADETAFDAHRFLAMVMTAVALLIVLAAAAARPGRQIVILSVVVLLLVSVVQSVLAAAGEDTALFGGLHAIFGIGTLGVASRLLTLSRPGGSR